MTMPLTMLTLKRQIYTYIQVTDMAETRSKMRYRGTWVVFVTSLHQTKHSTLKPQEEKACNDPL